MLYLSYFNPICFLDLVLNRKIDNDYFILKKIFKMAKIMLTFKMSVNSSAKAYGIVRLLIYKKIQN